MLRSKRYKNNIYIRYSLIFIVISALFMSMFAIFNRTMIWENDGFWQWYSIFVKFRSMIADVVHGNGLALWSWDTGLGADVIGNYAFVIFDPVNYIVAFFSKENIDIAYTVTIVIKLYLAGVSMLAYLKYYRKNEKMCIAGAIGYALCAWALVSIRHEFFITQLVLFPIIIMGIDKVDDKKSPITLITGVFFSVIISLYFSYMTAIFVAIYLVVKYFAEKEGRTVKDFLLRLLKFVWYAVIGGVLLAGPVLLPVFYSLINTSTDSGRVLRLLPTIKNLLRVAPGIASAVDVNENYTVLGTNGLVLLMIPIILSVKKKTTSMWMSVVCGVIVLIPALQSVLNGLSYPAGRWCYCFAFFITIGAIDSLKIVLENIEKYKKRLYIGLGIIVGISILAITFFGALGQADMALIALNAGFALLIYMIICMNKDDVKKTMSYVCMAVCANVALFALMYYSPFANNTLDTYVEQGASYEAYEDSSLKAATSIKDNELYRVSTVWNPGLDGSNIPYTKIATNTNIYWQVPSTFEYFSTVDFHWLEFNKLVGNSSGYNRRMTSFSNDNRTRIEYLLGVKYYLGENKKKAKESGLDYEEYQPQGYVKIGKGKGSRNIYQSEYDASIGYVFENAIEKSELEMLDVPEREQALMQSVQVDEEDAKVLKNTKIIGLNQIELEDSKKIGYSVISTKNADVRDNKISTKTGAANMVVSLDEKVQDCEIYIFYKNLKKTSHTVEEQIDNAAVYGEKLSSISEMKMKINDLSGSEYGNFISDVSYQSEKGNVIKRIVNAEGEPQGINDIEDYMINLGYMEDCPDTLTFSFYGEGEYTFDEIEIWAIPLDKFKTQATKLSEKRLNVTKYTNDYVAGNVSAPEGGMLYLSILYNDGWNIYIDGEKQDKLYRVNEAFTGVEITPGNHEVELKYAPIGFPYTIVAFFVGVAVCVIIVIVYKKRNKRGME